MRQSRLIASRDADSAARPSDEGAGLAPVTAVVCTRNGAAYVERQLASIATQTRPVSEVIVSDDASTDGTPELAARVLEAAGLPYRVFTRDEPLGVAANFHAAILESRDELVALSDQDDEWARDKIARLAPALEGEAALVAHSDAVLIDDDGAELEPSLFAALEISAAEWAAYEGGGQLDVLMRRNLVTGATAIVRRSFVERVGEAPAPWIHDEWYAWAAALTNGIRVVRAPLTRYRQHASNQIGQRTPTLLDKARKATGPGRAVQERKVARALALVEHADRLDASDEQRARMLRKYNHERLRLELPRARVARILPVVRRWRRGDYGVYSRGLADVVRDLLQSHEA